MDLHLDPERAAVHRLADSIWWGDPPALLEVATLHRRSRSSVWCFAIVAIAVIVATLHGC